MDLETLWLSSGRLLAIPGGYRCEVCGAEGGPKPSDMRHSGECTLARAVMEICLATGTHGDPPPDGEREIDRLVAGVSVQDRETISVLLGELRHGKSRSERLEAVRILQEMCPGMAPGDLLQYAVTGISDDAQMEGIRRHLLFERAVAHREAAMAEEMRRLMAARPPMPGR